MKGRAVNLLWWLLLKLRFFLAGHPAMGASGSTLFPTWAHVGGFIVAMIVVALEWKFRAAKIALTQPGMS